MTAGFYLAQAPVWSADGRHLLFWGQRSRDSGPEGNVDWYVAAMSDGAVVRTDARDVLLRQGFQGFHGLPVPDAWVGAANRIIFHGHIGDSWNMWQVPLAAGTWRLSGPPERATFGTTDEAAASATADGRMVFISRTMGADVWSLSIDADRGRVQGGLKRVTEDAADDYNPTLSADGATLVYRSRRAGQFDVVAEESRDRRRDRAHAHAGRRLSGGQPRRDEGRVLVSREWEDAPLRRRGRRRRAAAGVRRLRRGGAVVAGWHRDSVCDVRRSFRCRLPCRGCLAESPMAEAPSLRHLQSALLS